jgi:hypothetical protein
MDSLRLGQRSHVRSKSFESVDSDSEDVYPLEEIIDAQPGREPRGAPAGENMVGAGDVVAEGDRRGRTDKNGARIVHPVQCRRGVLEDKLQMLGREGIRGGERMVEVANEHGRTALDERVLDVLRLFVGQHEHVESGDDIVDELRRPCDQGMRAERSVLGLGDEVGRKDVCVRRAVRDDRNLSGSGLGIHTDPAGYEAFRERHVDVARADDLVHRSNRLRPVCERGDGLGTPHRVDLFNARHRARRKDGLGDLSSGGGWGAERDPFDAGNLCRHRRHDHARWIRGPSAGHVDAHASHGADQLPDDLVAGAIQPCLWPGSLARPPQAGGSDLERIDDLGANKRPRPGDLVGVHAQ